jgi:gas vesicle protein GvpL/GvpF
MSLRVYGVVMHDGQGPPKLPAGLQLIAVRELAAIAEEGDYSAKEVETREVERHLEVVGALFDQDAVLPTPAGTVFRSVEVLQRWMELHYVALSDALAWVEDRLGARVHITRAEGRAGDREVGADLAAIAAEIARSLRRRAVASVPLRNEELTGIAITSAYLVERALWQEFGDAIEDEREHHPHVKIELSGPWPPYDFVRLQFGA